MSPPTPPPGTRLIPPAYFLFALAVMIFFDRAAPGARFIRSPVTLVGVMPLAVGLGLVLSTAASLRRHHTTIKPLHEPSTLVTEGTFRVSRNPIYLGMVLMLLGLALMLGSATPFGVVAVFAWWMHTRFIAYEEAVLSERFGDQYRTYQASVRRWV
jgi:protein-S-isoprenylcysteine O-methyltransferase Ste14